MKRYGNLLQYSRPYWKHIILGSLIGFFTTGSNIGLMMTSAFLLAKASFHPSIAELQVAIVGVRFFGIVRGVFRYIERLITHNTTFTLLSHFRKIFYRKLYHLVPERISFFRFSDLMHRAISDIEHLQFFYLRVLHNQLILLFTLLFILLLFGFMQFSAAVIIVVWMVITALTFAFLSGKILSPLHKQIKLLEQKLRVETMDITLGMTDLLIGQKLDEFFQKHGQLSQRLFTLQKKIRFRENALRHAIGVSMNALIVAVSFWLIKNTPHTASSLIQYNVLIIGIMAAFEPLFALPDSIRYERGIHYSVERLQELDKEMPDHLKRKNHNQIPRNNSIQFKDVFVFLPDGVSLLENVNLEIGEHSLTAMVGESGKGKTTLSKIILRFYSHFKGEILIGGIPIQEISQKWIRENIGYLEQNPYIFSTALRENITLGDPNIQDEEIRKLFSLFQLENLLESLPEGLNSWIGEYGTNLSGGERRLIALMRVILKNTPILILDEPTTGLDPVRGQRLFSYLKQLSQKKTILVITHETRFLEFCDRVERI